MVRLRMNLRGNLLEHDHDAITLHHPPKILAVPVSSTFVGNFKTELGLIEVEARLKIRDDKEGSDAVEGRHGSHEIESPGSHPGLDIAS